MTEVPLLDAQQVPEDSSATEESINHSSLGFALFLLVNATLFIRPGEVIPFLYGVELYQYIILLCLIVSFSLVLEFVSPEAWSDRPIALCVLFLFPTILLSLLGRGAPVDELFDKGALFLKILVYLLLLMSLVRTPTRLRIFLGFLAFFAVSSTLLAILDSHDVIKLAKVPRRSSNPDAHLFPETTPEENAELSRLDGTGIFQDPNDFCLLIVTGTVLTLCQLADRSLGSPRFLWMLTWPVFGYGFVYTQSRGGLMGLLIGLGTFGLLRFGWRRSMVLGALSLPLLFAVLGGRQVDLSTKAETAQSRMDLWAEALNLFRGSPVFGVGMGHFVDTGIQVTHNTYLEILSELGLLGGFFFVGAFYLAILGYYSTYQYYQVKGIAPWQDPDLRELHTSVTCVLAIWMSGMFSLTLGFLLPTYTILGLAIVYVRLVQTHERLLWNNAPRLDFGMLFRLGSITIGVVIFHYLFVRTFLSS